MMILHVSKYTPFVYFSIKGTALYFVDSKFVLLTTNGETEVEKLIARITKDIRWFDVSENNAVRMQIVEGAKNIVKHLNNVLF